MPYLPPSPGAALPVHSPGRARHRRSYSENVPESPASPGAFAPLGVPSRGHRGTITTTPHGGPKFHFKNDQETSSNSDSDSEDDSSHPYPPVLKLKSRSSPTFGTAGTGNVPFPSTSRYSPTKTQAPQLLPPSPSMNSSRPNFPRNNSNPVLLSNGKPLKSSLKSSSSSPAISPTYSPAHLRAASAPPTPGLAASVSVPSTPVTPHKNVHFPREEEGQQLASVRIYSRSARPASISLPPSQTYEDTETETETDRDGGFGYFRQPSFASAGSSSMPFPKMPAGASGIGRLPARSRSNTLPSNAPTAAPTLSSSAASTSSNAVQKKSRKVWELDTMKCSAIPTYSPSVYANVHLESLTLVSNAPSSSDAASPPAPQISLKGSLLVRNLAFEKTVAVRFTLDEWETTSEVLAHHEKSLPSLPKPFFRAGSGLTSVDALAPCSSTTPTDSPSSESSTPESNGPTWDRFGFTVKLDDYAPSLHTRTLWFVARYAVPYVHTRAHSLDDLASFAALISSSSSTPSSPSIHGGNANRRASGGEWEMGMTRMGVVTGQGGEWWDNNAGGNYRVVFKVKDVEEIVMPAVAAVPPTLKVDTNTPTPTQDSVNGVKKVEDDDSSDEEQSKVQGKKNELGLRGMESHRERRNGGHYPFPITAPSLGTPTITFSPASPPTNSYFPPQPPPAPSLSKPTAQQQAKIAQELSNARAKTTLQHIRGLSLKNYAAPSAPVMQRSRSASPSLEPNTSSNGLGLGAAPGTNGERERNASTGSIPSSSPAIPPSATTPSISASAGAREITPSMMNMNVGEASGSGLDVLSSSPGMVMSTSPPYMSFGMGMGNMGRKWTTPGMSRSTITTSQTNGQQNQDGDDRSDTSSTSSNSTSDTPPLLSPLMSPITEFSSFHFDHTMPDGIPPNANAAKHHGGWGGGMMSFSGMFGGFPATIVNDPQSGELGEGMGVGFGETYGQNQPAQEDEKKHRQLDRQPPPQDGSFGAGWPWGFRRESEDGRGEEEREEHEDFVSPSPAVSTASTITPGVDDGPATNMAFRPRQPSPQPPLRRFDNAAKDSKPRRPHSPLSNPTLNRAAVKRPGGLTSSSRESSLESIPELAKANGVPRPPARTFPSHITNKPYTSSPLQSPLNSPSNSPRHSPRTSPNGSRSASPSPVDMQPPLSPASAATDSAYQAFVKKWCFAQGPTSVGGVRG